jgi:hypothetical protein
MFIEQSTYVCNKTSFKKAFAFPISNDYLDRVIHLINACQSLSRHATSVFKLFLLSSPENDFEYTTFEYQKIYSYILYLLNDDHKPKSNQDNELLSQIRFCIDEYIRTNQYQKPQLKNFQQLNSYISNLMYTNLLVNVQEHFPQMLLRYINERLQVKSIKKQLSKDAKKIFNTRLNALKKYLIRDVNDPPVDISYEEIYLHQELGWILPYDEYSENPLSYRILTETEQFVAPYCRLAKLYENYNLRMFSAIPLRRSFAVCHIPIDTKILLQNIMLRHDLIANMSNNKYDIWSNIFRLNSKPFKPRKGFKFDGRITTNGTSVSIYFLKEGCRKRSKKLRKSKTNIKARTCK